jgi:hypothetical protein
MDSELPQSLMEAMGTEPLWLQAWVGVLMAVNLAALLFVARREAGGWKVRWEPVAILVSFFAAAMMMDALYAAVGYVRLLGLAHLVFWGPVWGWILWHRSQYSTRNAFGVYLHAYLVIAGISLAIDALDVVRYLLGDGDLLGRWSGA